MVNLTGTRSTFPNQLDELRELYNLPPSQVNNANRYKFLSAKENKAPNEISEMNQLASSLADYIINPERWNKMGDIILKLQSFFRDNVEGYIDDKQDEFNVELEKFTHHGEYNPSTQYFKRNTISYQGEAYLALQNSLNQMPNSNGNTVYWAKIAARGVKGEQGVAGTGLAFRGAYGPSLQYVENDAVQYGGQVFACIQDNIGQEPDPFNPTEYWVLAIAKGDSTKVTEIKNRYVLNSEAVNIPIGISVFNKNTDSLTVNKNTTVLVENDDYVINANGISIDKISGTWDGTEESVIFEFKVLKNFQTNLVLTDGAMIQDGTIGIEKLKSNAKEELQKVDDDVTEIKYKLGIENGLLYVMEVE